MAVKDGRRDPRSANLTDKSPKAKASKKAAVKPKAKPAAAKAAPRAKAVKAAPKAQAAAKPAPQKAATRKKAPAPKPQRTELLALIHKILDDAKAEDIVELNLIGKNPMTDYMVVASGRSQRHVQALAEQLSQKLKQEGYGANIEGLGAGDWVLVDALDVVVHLFRPEVRSFYDLEQMWKDEPPVRAAS
jgi:ribosome-associated protein